MDFEYTPKVQKLRKRLVQFMDEHIYPNEAEYYAHEASPERRQFIRQVGRVHQADQNHAANPAGLQDALPPCRAQRRRAGR